LSFSRLLESTNGESALASYDHSAQPSRLENKNFLHQSRAVSSKTMALSSDNGEDDELTASRNPHPVRITRSSLLSIPSRSTRPQPKAASSHLPITSRDTSPNVWGTQRRALSRVTRSARVNTFRKLSYKSTTGSASMDSDSDEGEMNEREESDEDGFSQVYSDILGGTRARCCCKRRLWPLSLPRAARSLRAFFSYSHPIYISQTSLLWSFGVTVSSFRNGVRPLFSST
jgi:hypothetical protein